MIKILTYLALLLSISGFAQNTWSLEQCIEHANNNNIDIIKQKLQNKSTEEDITIAKGNYLPNANFSAFQNFSLGNSFNISTKVGQLGNSSNSFSLSSSLILFNGFKNKYQLQQARLNTQKGKVKLEHIGMDLSLDITNNYLQVLLNKEILDVAKEQEAITQQEVERITKLYEVALKPRRELLEMKSTLALDRKDYIIAENNVTNSLIELQELLDTEEIKGFGIEPVNIENFESNIVMVELNDIYNTALQVNPLLASSKLNTQINEKNIQLIRLDFYPKLSLNFSYSSNYYHIKGREDLVFNQETQTFEDNGFFTQLDNNKTHFIGFSLTIPIFNKFLTRSNVDKAIIEWEISQKELENQKVVLKNDIRIAYNNVISAKATLTASETALNSQKEAFSIAQKKYKDGYITSYEFLESKSKYIQTLSELISSKYDYLFKLKILEYYSK